MKLRCREVGLRCWTQFWVIGSASTKVEIQSILTPPLNAEIKAHFNFQSQWHWLRVFSFGKHFSTKVIQLWHMWVAFQQVRALRAAEFRGSQHWELILSDLAVNATHGLHCRGSIAAWFHDEVQIEECLKWNEKDESTPPKGPLARGAERGFWKLYIAQLSP